MRPSIGRPVGLTLIAVVLAAAQTIRPVFSAFEVATIKPVRSDDPKAGRYIRMQSAHRFEVKSYTVNGLVAAAYDLNPRAISGGPAWSESDRYDIIAVAPSDQRPNYDEQMAMLKKLQLSGSTLRTTKRKTTSRSTNSQLPRAVQSLRRVPHRLMRHQTSPARCIQPAAAASITLCFQRIT